MVFLALPSGPIPAQRSLAHTLATRISSSLRPEFAVLELDVYETSLTKTPDRFSNSLRPIRLAELPYLASLSSLSFTSSRRAVYATQFIGAMPLMDWRNHPLGSLSSPRFSLRFLSTHPPPQTPSHPFALSLLPDCPGTILKQSHESFPPIQLRSELAVLVLSPSNVQTHPHDRSKTHLATLIPRPPAAPLSLTEPIALAYLRHLLRHPPPRTTTDERILESLLQPI